MRCELAEDGEAFSGDVLCDTLVGVDTTELNNYYGFGF